MNYNIDNMNSFNQVSTVPVEQQSVIPTCNMNPIEPLVVDPIPISSTVESSQPIPVVSVQHQESIPLLSNMGSILADPQFFVKYVTAINCSSQILFSVYPCNYFGECNDQVEPMIVFLFTDYYLIVPTD